MKKNFKLITSMLLGGAVGFACAHYGMQWLKPFIDNLHGAWLLLILPSAIFLAVLLHEVGHLVGGSLNRFQFSMLCVFFMKVETHNGRLKIGYNRWLASWGGLAVMIPDEGVSRNNYLMFVAGGPLGSIIGLFLGFLLFQLSTLTTPGLAVFGAFFMMINGLLAIATMLPLNMDSNFDNDGTQFLDLLKGGDRAARKMAMARLVSFASADIRPAEYPEAMIAAVERPGIPDRDTLIAQVFRNTAQIDRKAWKEADGSMKAILNHETLLPPVMKRMIYLQATLIAGFMKEATEAEMLLQQAGSKGLADQTMVLLAQSSVNYASGNYTAIPHLLEEATLQLKAVTSPGSRRFYQSLIDELGEISRIEGKK